jgi:hypothetical protein
VENSRTSFLADQKTTWAPTDTAIPITISHERITIHGTVYRKLPSSGIEVINPPLDIPITIGNTTDFERALMSLTTWQKTLLQHTQFRIDPTQIRQLMEGTPHPWTLITDHHFMNDKTCFSWLLIQPDGSIVASGSGPCPGPPERTRADAWSILAGIQFVHQIWSTSTEDIRNNLRITLCNRNQRIIKRIKDLLTYTTIYCNSTLDRDWDIIREIATTAQQHHYTNLTWESMKAFLDTQAATNIQQLPLWQQHLIDTKQIATTASENVTTQIHHSPFLPSSRCMLHHDSSTIHGRYNMAYRDAASLPPLFSYLQKKNNWMATTSARINWTWFKKALRYPRESSHVTITKLVYNQLATQPRKATTGGHPWVDTQCPHCNDTSATFQHILRCNDPAAAIYRDKLLTTIDTICHRRHAPRMLRQTLREWFSKWLQHDTPDRTTLDPRLLPLYDAQQEIGWDLMTRGFLPKEWMTITTIYHPHRKKPNNHDLLFPKLISELWNQQLEFWKQYQDARHSDAENHLEVTASHAELQSQVRHLYSFSDRVLQIQRHRLFPAELDHFLAISTSTQLKNYIDQYSPAIKLSVRHATRRSIHNTRSLFTYGFTNPSNTPATATTTNITTTLTANQAPQPTPHANADTVHPTRPRMMQRLLTWARNRTSARIASPSIPTPSPAHHLTDISNTTTTPPHQPPHPTITRAHNHKHSRWRHTARQRQKFLSFFRR